MPECELLTSCPFFNNAMKGMDATAEVMKQTMCRKDNSQCARFLVYKELGREKVPSDLFPRQMDRAKRLVGS